MKFYDGRLFRPVQTDGTGDVDTETVFQYHQKDYIVTAEYSGGDVKFGQLIGIVDTQGNLDMRYHHVTMNGEIKTGTCQSRLQILENGKVRLHETWQWTGGNTGSGTSILEEV